MKTPLSSKMLLLVVAITTAQLHGQTNSSSAKTSQSPSPKALTELMPLFGNVERANVDLNRNGQVDTELLDMYFKGGKLSVLHREKLGLDFDLRPGNPSNTFARLPEVVLEIDSWAVRPSRIDYQPSKHPAVSDIKRILGVEASRERTEETRGTAKISVDWHNYGMWKFGATNGVIEVIRISHESTADQEAGQPKTKK